MFVVFEGIDGSGKTTLSNRVAARLRETGISVKHLRADGKFASSVTEALRELGRDVRNLHLRPEAEFFLYAARDVQLIAEVLRPALADHEVVIADRFLYTAKVLGESGRHLSETFTRPVLEAAALGIVPDLVVLVDVDPSLARARRKTEKLVNNDKRPPSRKGLGGVGLQHRLRRGYLELAAKEPERWAVVDNEGTLEDTMARVAELVEGTRRNGAKAALARFRSSAPATRAARPEVKNQEQALAAFLAWIDQRAEREPRTAAYFLSGLAGPGVDERRRAFAARTPEVVLAGLVGLADDTSFALREELADEHPRLVARSLAGLGLHPRAVALRRKLEDLALAEVIGTLARLDDEESWALRERAFGKLPGFVVGALGTLGSERAWELRERFRQSAPDPASSYEVSSQIARSVGSLADERAWAYREAARVAAPVAALASLGTLADDKSFRWREEFVNVATKVVMETLRRSTDERAWKLRRAVVHDCKEVIDSIHSLDDESAWELRDMAKDLWPSTVAKSLGPLADGDRGRALLLQLLETHPYNLSLWKHAAGVALGIHRLASNR
jgi:dTMP kinase